MNFQNTLSYELPVSMCINMYMLLNEMKWTCSTLALKQPTEHGVPAVRKSGRYTESMYLFYNSLSLT
jgi:hypothetical protein